MPFDVNFRKSQPRYVQVLSSRQLLPQGVGLEIELIFIAALQKQRSISTSESIQSSYINKNQKNLPASCSFLLSRCLLRNDFFFLSLYGEQLFSFLRIIEHDPILNKGKELTLLWLESSCFVMLLFDKYICLTNYVIRIP